MTQPTSPCEALMADVRRLQALLLVADEMNKLPFEFLHQICSCLERIDDLQPECTETSVLDEHLKQQITQTQKTSIALLESHLNL